MSAEEAKLDEVEVGEEPTYDEGYYKGYEVGYEEGKKIVMDAIEQLLSTF